MAGKSTKSKSAAPLAAAAEKSVSDRYVLFIEWLTEQTGKNVSAMDAPQVAQLSLNLYGKFQKSDVNKQWVAEQATARESERAAKKAAAASKKATAKKATGKKSSAAAASKKVAVKAKGRKAKKASKKSTSAAAF